MSIDIVRPLIAFSNMISLVEPKLADIVIFCIASFSGLIAAASKCNGLFTETLI